MLDAAFSEVAVSAMTDEGNPTLVPAPDVIRLGTHSFTTDATDSPANTPISGRVLGNFVLRREISGGPDGMFGGLTRTELASEVVLANGDRGLDSLIGKYVDGREIRFMIGPTTGAYQDMQRVFTTTAGAISADRDTVRVRLRDQGLLLQSEIQKQYYTGDGKREGDPILTGRSKPLLYGRCNNVPAQLIDEALLVYQVSDNLPLLSLTIYDAGVAIPQASQKLFYNGMVAADCPPGEAVVCLPQGFFRLQIRPSGQVTVNAATETDGSTAGLIDQILADAGVPSGMRSITSIPDHDTDQPGYFQAAGTNSSVEDVVGQLAFAAGAAFGADREGIFRLTWLDPDTFGRGPDYIFTDRDLVGNTPERVPLAYGIPWRGWVIGAARNWTVQTAELAQNISPQRRQFLDREFREIRTANPDIALRHSTSKELDLLRTFYAATGAPIRLGNRLLEWYALGRAMYRVVVKTALCQVELGDIVEIRSAHWDLDTGKRFFVVAVGDDIAAVETEMMLFG